MRVKTAEFKNHLSQYLRRVREGGETVIICDRDEPVALLTPIGRGHDTAWSRCRAEALARAQAVGLEIELPLQRPTLPCLAVGAPVVAGDGRTDVETIDLVRGTRGW